MTTYQHLRELAEGDDDVLAFLLLGSRGKAFDVPDSDHDVTLVVQDAALDEAMARYGALDLAGVDLFVTSLSGFQDYASWESRDHGDRYDYAHVDVVFDRSNDVKRIIKEKGRIPPEHLRDFLERKIDSYVNSTYRAVKCLKNGHVLGAHLEAADSMLHLLDLMFAFEGRHRPFLGYVVLELEAYPLADLPWQVDDFVKKLTAVMETADLASQQELLVGVENLARRRGYGHVFDAWSGKDRWAMTYRP